MRIANDEFIQAPLTIFAFGCDQYDNLSNLHGVKNDIDRIKDVFCGDNDYALYEESDFIEVYNKNSAVLRTAINDYIISRSADGDVVLIYFGGHGTAIGQDNFGFCMKDAYRHPDEEIILPTSVVTINEIISALHIKSIFPIFLIDSCYSGAIAKQMNLQSSQMALAISKNLVGTFASDFGFLTVTDDVTPATDSENGGVLSTSLEDICRQGLGEDYSKREFFTISELIGLLLRSLHENGDKRARAYSPSGQIADYAVMKNVQYSPPEIPENRYSFTSIYKKILDALWNNGDEVELDASEILEQTGSQSAYGNHNKLSYAPWSLVEDSPDSRKRRLTDRGREFIQGKIKIPKVIIVRKDTQKCRALKNSERIKYSDL
jgi:hypothetical protein